MTASLMKERTPSWSTIEGILSDKYKSSDDQDNAYTQPTQSTQNTVIQRPLTPDTPRGVYYSQPQFRRRSVGAISDLPSSLPTRTQFNQDRYSGTADFGVSEKQTLNRLKKEILAEESKILARTGELSSEMRKQAEAAVVEPQTHDAKLDLSQSLSHSILEEQAKTRLKIAKPNSDNENFATVSSISVDMTPLTEDLLMNSRVEGEGDNADYVSITQSDGGKTISDTQLPNLDDDDLIFTPLSDDELTRFATPPRTTVEKENIIKPAPHRPGKRRVQLQSQGKVIGSTELTSFDETSSMSVADSNRFKDAVKPLKRHAWSDSETENSMSKPGNKNQFENNLFTHEEPVSVSAAIKADRPKSASSKHDDDVSASLFRPYTAPSSEKLEKFEIEPRIQDIPPVKSDSTIDSEDYPNLRNSFISLQQTIMSDIAALKKEIVEKQAGTERLRAEFCDFKHAYYESLVEKKAADSKKVDALIQTSQGKEYISPVREKESSYGDCDSDTERQLATLKVLQRSLRQQAEERREEEKKLLKKSATDKAHQTEMRMSYNRSIQTSPKPRMFSDMQVNTSPYATMAQQTSLRERDFLPPPEVDEVKQTSFLSRDHQKDLDEFDLPLKSPSPKGEKDDSLDSTERATREMFMEILRKKAEIDEKEKDEKRKHRYKDSSTPKPSGLIPAKGTFTPASTVASDDCSTITDGTYVVEDDVAALDGLWKEFMKYVIQSKVLKRHRKKGSSDKTKPCLQLDTKNLQKLQHSIDVKSPKRKPAKSNVRQEGKRYPRAEAFEVSLPDHFDPKTYKRGRKSPKSIDSREERINFLIKEIENERRIRDEANKKELKPDDKAEDLDKIPSKENGIQEKQKPPVDPPANTRPVRKEPVAFDISWDIDSLTSEEVERAPGYPNMIFKTGRLQDAFYAHRRNFIKKSRRRALHIQLRKEAREKFRTIEPPPRPRPTIDPKYFAAFDIPPPETRVISEKEMRKNSRKLAEVQEKKHQKKVRSERETYRLRGQNYSKRVQDALLGKKYMNSVRVY